MKFRKLDMILEVLAFVLTYFTVSGNLHVVCSSIGNRAGINERCLFMTVGLLICVYIGCVAYRMLCLAITNAFQR